MKRAEQSQQRAVEQLEELKRQLGGCALVGHVHSMGAVEGLESELSSKATVKQQEGMQIESSGLTHELKLLRQEISNKADVSHTHTMSDVTKLVDELQSKAIWPHTHGLAQVEGL